jgi:hypothetical protein
MKNKQKTQFTKLLSIMAIFLLFASACEEKDKDPALAAPRLENATEVKATSFKASWSKVDNAKSYLLDVSRVANFSTKVTGYDRKEITDLNTTVTGLQAETKYYFRVYSKSGASVSSPSAAKEVTTIK